MESKLRKYHLRWRLLVLSLFLSIVTSTANSAGAPPLLLAETYQKSINLEDYWVSEKYDGYRAYWNGKHLVSRQGNIFYAPAWFTKNFPARRLDGELWLGRQQFESLASVVRQNKPHQGWSKVRYMVFDLPGSEDIFDKRLETLEKIINSSANPYLILVPQTKYDNHHQLLDDLTRLVAEGGEGLMLHRGQSHYRSGRSIDLLKLKPLQDAEAKVIDYLPGKGKHTGKMGALLVELPSGLRFRIGTGFTDEQRQSPPSLGTLITFQYTGLTKRGVPRFARFKRVRNDINWNTPKNQP